MTSAAVARVQAHFDRLSTPGSPRVSITGCSKPLRSSALFPANLSALEVFEEMLASVIAQPRHYPLVRDVRLQALEAHSAGDTY